MSTERAREMGLPVSRDSASARRSRLESMRSARRRRMRERSAAEVLLQAGNAAAADLTAASMSAESESGVRAKGEPVAGSKLSRYWPAEGGTFLPPMKLASVSIGGVYGTGPY
jgi:hypothetical protein